MALTWDRSHVDSISSAYGGCHCGTRVVFDIQAVGPDADSPTGFVAYTRFWGNLPVSGFGTGDYVWVCRECGHVAPCQRAHC